MADRPGDGSAISGLDAATITTEKTCGWAVTNPRRLRLADHLPVLLVGHEVDPSRMPVTMREIGKTRVSTLNQQIHRVAS